MADFREPHLRDRDFLGAFGVIRRAGRVLFVQNVRTIAGVPTPTWDLPGGQLEPGELCEEALARELYEELGIRVRGRPEFLFFQEGVKLDGGRRRYAWRSFFYAVGAFDGEPEPRAEIAALRWLDEAEQAALLTAPYHDSYLQWARAGGAAFRSRWDD